LVKKPPPNEPSGLADRLKKIATTKPPAIDPASQPVRSVSRPTREERRAVFKNGILEFTGGAKLDVVVKNVTTKGARIEFHERVMLPGEVQFASPMLGIRKRARVVWQDENTAGLEFID
jgi:hypothetical protein